LEGKETLLAWRGTRRERRGTTGEILMLHGEVHGALEVLDAGVDHLPGKSRKCLLDVQIEVRVVQIVTP
jgi:hypothetical protein